ncbi:MAG: hypothetical protein ACREEM_50370 [Blastocatellia bacterium]
MSKPIIAARVNAAEFEAATRAAQSVTAESDHARQAAEIVNRLRAHQPQTISQLIRVICGLPPAPVAAESLANGDEARTTRIYAKVSAGEKAQAERFLDDYPRARKLAERIEERLRQFAPIATPAQLARAIIGLEQTSVGAPAGNRNAARKEKAR